MTQDYFVFPPFEVYTGEQLTKEVKQSLIARGLKCVAIVFNCESYNEDAVKAAEILGTPLINRHTEKLNKMTGFPNYSLDKYLPKLIRASQRVAICDQLTTPQK